MASREEELGMDVGYDDQISTNRFTFSFYVSLLLYSKLIAYFTYSMSSMLSLSFSSNEDFSKSMFLSIVLIHPPS